MTYRFELYKKIKRLEKEIKRYDGLVELLIERDAPTRIIEHFEASRTDRELEKSILNRKLEILSRA